MSKTPASKEISRLSGQRVQTIFPAMEREVNGVGMGVLDDGTPFLTQRGLARLCGIDQAAISRLANKWAEEKTKPRGQKIQELLESQDYFEDSLYFNVRHKEVDTFAFPDSVCMAVLEYYAFEATQGSRDTALSHYRYLARISFRTFIYNTCGYDPQNQIPQAWKTYHERVLLNDQMPIGFFSVFREIAELVIHMIKNDCAIDEHTVPDISVGIAWAKHWNDNEYDDKFGERKKFPHVYPEWFPQALANPIPAWVYPIDSLGVFRTWIYENYVPDKFPKYISNKVKSGKITMSSAQLLIETVSGQAKLPDRTGE